MRQKKQVELNLGTGAKDEALSAAAEETKVPSNSSPNRSGMAERLTVVSHVPPL
jgi:hypothetical protein